MKTARRLVLIWVAAGVLLFIGIALLVVMFLPGLNKGGTLTPNAFEMGASITVTRFFLPVTWTPAAPPQADLPHPTANQRATSTHAALVMPTLGVTYRVVPTLTEGPTQTTMPTTTSISETVKSLPTSTAISLKVKSLPSPLPTTSAFPTIKPTATPKT
jgi:hypothetical protein